MPQILTDNHNNEHLTASMKFVDYYDKDSLHDRIVTRGTSLDKHVNFEIKLQSLEGGHTQSPKTKQLFANVTSKDMASEFHYILPKEVFQINFLETDVTINFPRNCETFKNLKKQLISFAHKIKELSISYTKKKFKPVLN